MWQILRIERAQSKRRSIVIATDATRVARKVTAVTAETRAPAVRYSLIAMKALEKPRGRPRSFDRDKALERAMHVFWRQGYEATSVNDLTRAMRINPPSLYAAFGDKEHLYLEALERYQQSRLESVTKWLDEEPTAKAGVARLLTEAAGLLVRSGAPRGSMLVDSAMNCADASLQPELAQRRASGRA